jgi:hypothetical protein
MAEREMQGDFGRCLRRRVEISKEEILSNIGWRLIVQA